MVNLGELRFLLLFFDCHLKLSLEPSAEAQSEAPGWEIPACKLEARVFALALRCVQNSTLVSNI